MIEAGQVLGAGGRVSELWRVPQGMGDGGTLEACVPLCPGGGGEAGRRGGGGTVGRCVTCCKATRGVPMSWGPWGG